MSSSGTESDSSASSDVVDFDDYGEFGYQLEPEYTEEELRQMEEAARDHLNLATTILVRVLSTILVHIQYTYIVGKYKIYLYEL